MILIWYLPPSCLYVEAILNYNDLRMEQMKKLLIVTDLSAQVARRGGKGRVR